MGHRGGLLALLSACAWLARIELTKQGTKGRMNLCEDFFGKKSREGGRECNIFSVAKKYGSAFTCKFGHSIKPLCVLCILILVWQYWKAQSFILVKYHCHRSPVFILFVEINELPDRKMRNFKYINAKRHNGGCGFRSKRKKNYIDTSEGLLSIVCCSGI